MRHSLMLLATLSHVAFAQSASTAGYSTLDSLRPPRPLETAVTIDVRDAPVRDVMNEIARQASVSIVFEPSLAGVDRHVAVHAVDVSAARVIGRVLAGLPIDALTSGNGSLVLVAKRRIAEGRAKVGGIVHAGEPLSGVRIALEGTRFETVSDDQGRFRLGGMPPGAYRVSAMRIGFEPVDQLVQLAAGESLELNLALAPVPVPLDAVIVIPGYFGALRADAASSRTLTRPQIETVPQIGEDVYRAISRLPGVATTDLSARFVVRGESSDGLLVTLDGLPLLEPFHLKDMGDALSIVDLASLGSAELMTGGPSAEYGDQIAGVFRLQTLTPRVDRRRAGVGLTLTNLRGMTQGGFAGGNGGWLASGRRGYLDLAFKIANLADSIYPRYNDVFGKLTYALPLGGELALHVLRAGDALRYQDAREPRLETRYTSDYVWARALLRPASALRTESVLWFGALDWRREGQGSDVNRAFPSVEVTDSRALRTVGLRSDWSYELSDRQLVKLGADLRYEEARYDYSRQLTRQIVENQALVTRQDDAAIALDPRNRILQLYLAHRIRPLRALTLEAGVRYDGADATRDGTLSPRLNAAWTPSRRTTIRSSLGEYVQRQSTFGLQVQDGVTTFAPAERARQAVVGWDQEAGRGLVMRVESYHRTLSSIRPRYINATTAINVLPELAYDRVLLAPTSGSSRGVELGLARPAGTHVDWSAHFVASTATQLVDGVRIPRATDQPYAAHLDWSLHPQTNAWRFTASVLWHSGWPYTPDSVRIDTIGTGSTQRAHATWTPGSLYSRRLGNYERIDVRWTRFFDTREGRVSLFVDVYNVFNVTNVRDHYTNVAISGLNVRYVDRTREQLPRIPSFGFNWEF